MSNLQAGDILIIPNNAFYITKGNFIRYDSEWGQNNHAGRSAFFCLKVLPFKGHLSPNYLLMGIDFIKNIAPNKVYINRYNLKILYILPLTKIIRNI